MVNKDLNILKVKKKWAKDEQIVLQVGNNKMKEMFTIINYQGDENRKHNKIPLPTHVDDCNQKDRKVASVARTWRNVNLHRLVVGV